MTVGEMAAILATYEPDQPMFVVLHLGNQVFKQHNIYDVGAGGDERHVYVYARENVTGRRAAKRK